MAREAGLDTAALSYMNVADVLDYVAEWVNEQERIRKKSGATDQPREATQADIDMFLGRKTEG